MSRGVCVPPCAQVRCRRLDPIPTGVTRTWAWCPHLRSTGTARPSPVPTLPAEEIDIGALPRKILDEDHYWLPQVQGAHPQRGKKGMAGGAPAHHFLAASSCVEVEELRPARMRRTLLRPPTRLVNLALAPLPPAYTSIPCVRWLACQTPILCHGWGYPPCVGKTLAGARIARRHGPALRAHVAGRPPSTRLRSAGNRRTYNRRRCPSGSSRRWKAGRARANPVIILDEIDKGGRGTFPRDPRSAAGGARPLARKP